MYKYCQRCQRRLFEKIYRGLSGIDVVIDTFGNEEFRDARRNGTRTRNGDGARFLGRSLIKKIKISGSVPSCAAHREPELLFSEIGKLKVELDWLKKKSGISRS